MRIVIGEGSCGIAAGASKVHTAFSDALSGSGIAIGIAGCIGMCFLEPIVDIYDGKMLLKRLVKVKSENADEIALALKNNDFEALKKYEISDEDSVFLKKQTRIALRRCGLIDPESINAYTEDGGYTALKKVLTSMTPEDVIEEIKTSGLAGRGGA
ncbi:MAG: NADH-quinone oxidoreductase subunit F, partial [Clostridia bacterium]|nr:NADH-quinone oxidoreductase subunit F [Clostridia bacterium]